MSAFEKTWAPLTCIARKPRAAAPRTAFSMAFLMADRSVSSESSARGTVDSITTVRAHAGVTIADISSRTSASGTRCLMACSLFEIARSLATSIEHARRSRSVGSLARKVGQEHLCRLVGDHEFRARLDSDRLRCHPTAPEDRDLPRKDRDGLAVVGPAQIRDPDRLWVANVERGAVGVWIACR